MATTTDYTIGIKSIYDATGLTTGVTSAKTALSTLETEIDSSATSMNTSLQTVDTSVTSTFGTGGTLDTSADSVINTSGRKLKAAGSVVGEQFAESLTTGVATGDVAGTVTGLFSGLAAVGGIAAIGVGLGAALIGGMARAASANRQEFVDAVNEGFKAIEIQADTTMREINQTIMDQFTFTTVLEELGGAGGVQAGLAQVRELAEDTGAEFNDIVDILRGEINPANRDTLRLIKAQSEETDVLGASKTGIVETSTEEANLAKDILELTGDNVEKKKQEVDLAKTSLEYEQDREALLEIQADYAHDLAEQSERYAAALERANDAALAIAGRRVPSYPDMAGTG